MANAPEEHVSEPQEATQVSRVGVKLAPFWTSDPEFWFVQAEAVFQVAGVVSEQTKFNHVVSQLTVEHAQFVKSIVKSPTIANKYQALKTALISAYADTEETKLRKLLTGLELGDDKPSHLLSRMRDLGTACPDEMIKSLWLQRLPQNIQQVLAVGPTEIDRLAVLADKVLDLNQNARSSIAAAQSAPATREDRPSDVLDAIAAVNRRLDRIEHDRARDRSRASSRFRARDRSYSGHRQSPDNGLCYYHDRFGDRARKCRPPCRRAQSNPQNSTTAGN